MRVRQNKWRRFRKLQLEVLRSALLESAQLELTEARRHIGAAWLLIEEGKRSLRRHSR